MEEKGTKRKCKGEYSSLRVNIANKREINQKGCMKSTIQYRARWKKCHFRRRRTSVLISYQYADT